MAPPVKVGLVRCGVISGIYLCNCAKFENLEVAACADCHLDRAEARAKRYGFPGSAPWGSYLSDPQIEIVLNLTQPVSHASIALAALDNGKSVYNEKPLAVERGDAERILAIAECASLLPRTPSWVVGCRPAGN